MVGFMVMISENLDNRLLHLGVAQLGTSPSLISQKFIFSVGLYFNPETNIHCIPKLLVQAEVYCDILYLSSFFSFTFWFSILYSYVTRQTVDCFCPDRLHQ